MHLPKHAGIYRLRRVYWLIQNYHRLLEHDPLAISAKAYLDLLNEYVKLLEEAQKHNWNTVEGRKRARAGVDTKNLAKGGQPKPEAGVGEALPFGLGAGVPAPDSAAGPRRN